MFLLSDRLWHYDTESKVENTLIVMIIFQMRKLFSKTTCELSPHSTTQFR